MRQLLLDSFLRRLENNEDDWTDDDKISLENVEKAYFYGAFREENAKNYLNKRDKFDNDRDAASLSGDDDSDSTISDDYSAGDSDLDDIADAQTERKVTAELELKAIDLQGYLMRIPHNTDASENRYTDSYVHR